MIDRTQAGVRVIATNGAGAETLAALQLEATRRVAELEPTERQALAHLVRGCSLIGIAGQMGKSLEEAVLLKASLMKKLGAHQTADLIRLGIYARVDEDR